jgi:hypothetical protein
MNDYPYREIIELRSVGLALGKIAYLCGCGAAKVSSVCTRAAELGLGWPVPVELTDDELARLLDPRGGHPRRAPIDFAAICRTLGHEPDAGKPEEAYAVYLSIAEGEPYARSTFAEKLREWAKSRAFSVKMLINWHPGEEVQVDWAGKKLLLHNANGQETPVSLFVATLPYSDLTFVRASLDMGMQTWLEHHRALFAFLGGVPLFVAPDNLATGVVFEKPGGPRKPHPRYRELCDYYGAMVLPARVRRPTDKAAVESHVRIMANRIVGTLDQMRFSSIDQMNVAISELLDVYNDRPSAAFRGRSRREIFEDEERPCLQPLPKRPFNPVTWRKVGVSHDGVIRVRGNYYGVPERYAGQKVEVKISGDSIEAWTSGKGQCVARHQRREDGSETFEGLPGVSPDRFKPLDEWCVEHGRTAMLAQWDREANCGKGPGDYVCRSQKPVHWKCPDCGFGWTEAPARRTGRSFDDCLACADVALVPGKNDLATVRPDIAAEWHPTRNPVPASAFSPDFKQQVWWLGECGHEWRAPVAKRVGSHEAALCPYCSGKKALPGFNDVATLAPELARLFHPVKNRNLTPDAVSVASNREVYLWDGVLSHIYRISPRKWLVQHGRSDVLEPFDSAVEEARALDAESEPVDYGIGKAMSSVKWTRFLKETGLRTSFGEWCEVFGHSDLLAQWDEERNGNLGPYDVTRASMVRVWWRCGNGHEWRCSVRIRAFRDAGCPYCDRRRALPGFNSAECLDANLVRLWHPTKNGDLTPDTVSDRSNRRIWLQCPKCGYEWQETLRGTTESSRTCPACAGGRQGFLVVGENDLASERCSIARQLHPTLNGDLAPENLYAHSNKEVWWLGDCGHVWREKVSARTARMDNSCPFCSNRRLLRGFNDLATRRPDLAAQWDPELNGALTPEDVKVNSSKRVWWRGECGHVWDMDVAGRVNYGEDCPYCSGHRVLAGFNDLASHDPEIAAQWHPTRNGEMTPDQVVFGSAKQVCWICGDGHEWRISVFWRTEGRDRGCPYCHNRKVLKGYNDLATTHPELAKQWDSERNAGLTAEDVIANSCKRVWWRCGEGHEWAVPIANRTHDPGHDPGCPYCSGRKVLKGYNDLATTHSSIAAMWHPHMNKGLKPTDVMANSCKKVWWRGTCGHVYDMKVKSRVEARPGYCPYCSGRRKPERPIGL